MNPCLKNIVSVSDFCADEATASTSGYDLMQAPEITVGNLANMATETYVSGLQLARKKLDFAIMDVGNDFRAALHLNGAITNMDERVHETSIFQPTLAKGMSPKERGVTIIKSTKIRGRLRKLRIVEVQAYPLTDGDEVEMSIYDENGTVSRYTVELVAGRVNSFKVDYTVQGKFARVVFDNTEVDFASSEVVCGEGCDGSLPNDCGYSRGFDGTTDIKKGDGYGVNVKFGCYCDYEELLCSLAKSFIGKIVWLKARVLLLEESLHSNRLSGWVVYGREEAEKHKAEVENEYREAWNTMVQGLPSILKQYKDDCLLCRGITWKVNL